MNKALKWIGIVVGCLVVLAIIFGVVFYMITSAPYRAPAKTALDPDLIPPGIETTVAFVNINVVPMDSERLLAGQTVVVEDGRITALGSSESIEVPTDAHVIDGAEKYLMPGLSDMHIHLLGSENDLLLYLANGITTIRDMGDGPPIYLDWRDQVIAGTRIGPSLWVSSPSIRELEGLEAIVLPLLPAAGIVSANTPEDAEKLVDRYKVEGYDLIKTKFIFSSEIYQAILESAARHGLLSDGHIPWDMNYCDDPLCQCEDRMTCWNDLLSMEVEAVAHLGELLRTVDQSDASIRQAAQDVADDGMWVSTTIFLMRSLAAQNSDLEGQLAKPEVAFVNPSHFVLEEWLPGDNEAPEIDRSWITGKIAAYDKMLLALHEAGALLMSGTDSPIPMMIPGFSLHDELATMVDIGLSPYEALRTSTYNPALYLGELDDFGTIEVGKRADLLLLEKNPLDDIANTRQIAGVMVRDRWYTRADLNVMLEQVALANQD